MKNDIEIGKLFGQRYSLDPLLQRSYEWDVNRVVNFINDILHVKFNRIGGGSCRYNIGDFITYNKDEFGDDDVKLICDGQQRITTLVLIFANIYHHNPSESKKGGIEDILQKSIRDEANKSLSNKSFTKKSEDYSKSPYFINSKHLCKYTNWTIDTVEDNEKFYFEMLSKHYELN